MAPNSSGCRILLSLSLLIATAREGVARAYPTSVVFAPTGDARGAGEAGALAYSSLNVGPTVSPGVTWLGLETGVVPRLEYVPGLAFGGLEVGVDVFNADLAGTQSAFVKMVLNAKAQLFTETPWTPHVAVGVIGFAPLSDRGQNGVYAAFTKSIAVGARSFGRVTGGLAHYFARNPTVFHGSWPLADTRNGLLAGYESPAFGPFSFAVDHVGGSGEINSSNIALNFTPVNGATIAVGGYLGNDRRVASATYDGAFAYLYMTWNFLKVFGIQAASSSVQNPSAEQIADGGS